MRSIRKLALMGLAALMVLAVVASAASATTVESPSGTAYSGNVTGTNSGTVNLLTSSGFGNVSCNNSTLGGSVTNNSPSAGLVAASISSASWTNCSNNLGQTCTATAQNLSWNGSVTSPGAGTADGTLTVTKSPYAGATVTCGSITCNYGASSVSVDLFNPGNPAGTTTSRAVANAALTKQSGSSFLCAAGATWQATYTLLTSGGANLYVV